MVNVIDYSWTGHAGQYVVPLKQSISAICRSDRGIDCFYIGIASGTDFDHALRRRIDARKMAWGVTDIWCLYHSTSHRSVRYLEQQLVDYFRKDPRSQNIAAGGGGRLSAQPRHFLYLAHLKNGVTPEELSLE